MRRHSIPLRHHRRVVAGAFLGAGFVVYANAAQRVAQGGADEQVVNAHPQAFGEHCAAIIPPCVVRACGVNVP